MTASPRSAPSSSSVAPSSSSTMLPSDRSATAASLSNSTSHGHAHLQHAMHTPDAASPLPVAHALPHSQHQLYSPPNSVSSISTYSPSSTSESPSGHQLRNQHSRAPHYQRLTTSYANPSYQHDSFPSSAPADSSPRSFSRSTYDQDKYPRQELSPPSFVQPSPRRHHYQLHQSYPTSAYPSGVYNEYRKEYERTPPPLLGLHEGINADISSNLPEYSYPMTPSQRPRRLPQRPIHHHHHDQLHHYRQYEPQHEQEQDFYGQSAQRSRNPHSLQQEQATKLLQQQQQQQQQQQHKIPPPIRTKWSDDRVSRECPPLTFQSGSNVSLGFRSADWMSPATPRSTQIQGSVLHLSSADPYPMVDSPVDFREPRGFQHSFNNMLRKTYEREDDDMEHCSEQEDTGVREFDDGEEDEDEDEAYMVSQRKRQRLSASDAALTSFGSQLSLTSPTYKFPPGHAESSGKERAHRHHAGGERDDDHGPSTVASSASSRKPSVSNSLQGDERPALKGKKTKITAPKRAPRSSPLQPGDAVDPLDDEGHAGTGIPSLTGKGLRIYSQRVCERVEAKGSTSYNELVHELVGGKAGELVEDAPEVPGQENIRRRVYDALNVLQSLDIISFDNKDIRWVGIEESRVVQEVSRRSAVQVVAQGGSSHHEGDDESEEPEDDDMEIEKLQKEVDAMKLRNELVQAQLQDQVTRHVQVLNLVKRNKRREAKEHEREERRRQRKEDKRARAMLADQDPSMTDVVPLSSSDLNEEQRRRSERHPRHRSPRLETGRNDEVEMEEEEEEDEESRRRRKQERRERRERKEKRAQRRLEKEKEHSKIQLPFVVVRMPGYASQSSDSEASISVVRRVRDEQKSRRGSKGRREGAAGSEGTTMVEIKIPQQEDVSIISDTEILGDLGYNTVELDELQAMLPPNLMDNVQYAVSLEDNQERTSPSSQRRLQAALGASAAAVGVSTMDLNSSPLTSVTVRGGFEREIVRAASEGASSSA